jgi:hypothetical protein
MLNYKEIVEVLDKLEKEYIELKKSGNSLAGTMGIFFIRKARAEFKAKILKKYSKE